ncbi:MAG: Sec-independent protein translocase subunit TatA [Actinomycetales bacterium]|nr:Sec-independent protein translocase subunit TatA [Actinomycetales bacterium]
MVRGLFDNPWQLVLVLLVVVLLFGGKRLPDAARGLGRSLRIFKSEIKELQDDGTSASPSRKDPAKRGEPEALEGRIVDAPVADREKQTSTDRRPEA